MTSDIFIKLYDTFSDYHISGDIDGCYCDLCLSKEYSDYLVSKPLIELESSDFISYLTSADILKDNSQDFKHFLPRLLEIAYETQLETNDFNYHFWIVLSRTNHQGWSLEEQNVLRQFAQEYLDKAAREKGIEALENARLDIREAAISLENYPSD